jgi:H/ACA ribonucleoprotein complex subunit 2
MGKDKSEKKEKKEKKEKRSETDGVKKSKKEKKSKLSDDNIAAAIEHVSNGAAEPTDLVAEVANEHEDSIKTKPVGALVPFANPLADEKVTKKVLKSVKKGSTRTRSQDAEQNG